MILVEEDGVQAHPAGTGRPLGRSLVLAQRGQLLPVLAAVVGALNDLPEPTRVLCGIDPVRVNRRALDVVDIPASKVRAADVPLLALRVRGHDERPLMRTNQYPNSAHASLLPESSLPALREYGTSQLKPGSLLPRSGRQRGRRRLQAGEPSPRPGARRIRVLSQPPMRGGSRR